MRGIFAVIHKETAGAECYYSVKVPMIAVRGLGVRGNAQIPLLLTVYGTVTIFVDDALSFIVVGGFVVLVSMFSAEIQCIVGTSLSNKNHFYSPILSVGCTSNRSVFSIT